MCKSGIRSLQLLSLDFSPRCEQLNGSMRALEGGEGVATCFTPTCHPDRLAKVDPLRTLSCC